jgi:hypothetical protein
MGDDIEFVVVYRWPDGREEVRYRRPSTSGDAAKLKGEVDALVDRHGGECPYSYRYVSKQSRGA